MSRGIFIFWLLASFIFLGMPDASARNISRATIVSTTRYSNLLLSQGDVWTATWGPEMTPQRGDDLYVINTDGLGFGYACGFPCPGYPSRSTTSANALSIIAGGPTTLDDANGTGRVLRCLVEFGYTCQRLDQGGLRKNQSIHFLNNVLYMTSFWETDAEPFLRTQDATIYMSTDKGQTWTPSPSALAPVNPMFPGGRFGTLQFIAGGQNGSTPGDYVYAVSSDGLWYNGNSLVLGRVLKTRLARLDANDWEFIQKDRDGKPDPTRWARGLAGLNSPNTAFIFPYPNQQPARPNNYARRVSSTGIYYIDAIGQYVLPLWYYPQLAGEAPTCDPTTSIWQCFAGWSRWEFFASPNPWGPWTRFFVTDWSRLTPGSEPYTGLYNPNVVAKFTSPIYREGGEDKLDVWLFATGDWTSEAEGEKYSLHKIKMTLVLAPP